MQNAQEALSAMQDQALEAIKSGQSTALDAVKNWTDTVAKTGVSAPSMPDKVTSAVGDPKEIIDSVYDFAGKLIELNKQFVQDLLEASEDK